MSHCLWVKGDEVRVITDPTAAERDALGDWEPAACVVGPLDVNKQLADLARETLDAGGDMHRAIEFYFKVEKSFMVKCEIHRADGDRTGEILKPALALLATREALEDESPGVTLTFSNLVELDTFTCANDEFQPADDWINPNDVQKAIDVLGDQWVMASNQMNSATSDEAARQWGTRMRGAERAQAVLKELLS